LMTQTIHLTTPCLLQLAILPKTNSRPWPGDYGSFGETQNGGPTPFLRKEWRQEKHREVKVKQSNRFGSLSSRTLLEFERKHSLRLPEDYRRFLLEHNGGDPHPTNTIDFEESGRSTSSDVQFIYGIHGGEYWASLEWHLECYEGRIIEDGLPIAGDSFGNQYVLVTRGERAGQVYFWDHERETDPPGYANMSYVAASFTEFTEKLYEYVAPGEFEPDRILRQNDLGGLRRLLDSGYDVERTDEYGRTLIENAAIKNRPEIIQMLSDHGAQLRNALGYAGRNAEFFEAYKASVDLLERLKGETGG
jgi:hypothetical protein